MFLADGVVRSHQVSRLDVYLICLTLDKDLLLVEHLLQLQVLCQPLLLSQLLLALLQLEVEVTDLGLRPLVFLVETIDDS